MKLLERDTILAEIDAFWRAAAGGRGSVLFVGGEAGVGKTTLIGHLCEAVRPSARVFVGACDPLSTPPPLGPLVDIADTLPGGVARDLQVNAPREQVFRAFLRALTDEGRPTLVVFEDIHWADEATLDLLRFLARRIETTRTCIVTTYRDDEIGPAHPLRIMLGDLATVSAVRRLAVQPLSESAVRALAAGSDIDPRDLHRRTGGNPFFVTEVLTGSGDGLPETVRDAILGRAARLSPAGRATLEAAAVIGVRIEPWLLAALCGDQADTDDYLEAGLLQVEDSTLRFRHALAREAVLGAIPPPRLLVLHQAVLAALLRARGGPVEPSRIAHHAEAAGDRALTLTYALAAARDAARLGAHREAAAQYARTLRVATDLDPPRYAALLEDYARECAVTAQLDEALRAYREAIEHREAQGDRLRVGENLSRLASLLVVAGRNAEAEEASHDALSLLETLPVGPQRALAYRTHAHLRMLDRDSASAIAWGEKALALAEHLGEQGLVIDALNTVGSAMLVAGDLAGRAYLERSGELARRAGLDDQVALAFVNLGSGLGEQYHFALASRFLEEGIAYSTERDLDRNRLYMLAWQAICRMYQGRWQEATEDALAVTRRPTSAAISRIMALVALGRVRARRGDPEVQPLLDEALALATQTGTLQRIAPVYAARAEAAALRGDLARTAAEARAAYALAIAHNHAWFASELGYWLARAGEPVTVPDLPQNPFALQVAGDWAAAAARWQELGCPYEAARALAEAADEAALRQALTAFERLGARPMRQAVARQLREHGVKAVPRGPRPSTRANAAGLTRREVEIVRLLAADLRNAEIANELSLSPKTIEHHISSILAKLNVRTRAAAVRAAAARDLLAQSGGEEPPK